MDLSGARAIVTGGASGLGAATAQHFRASQQRSVVYELWRRVFCLGWPDVMLQPIHQRQIVGQTSEKRHCRMGVQVN